MEIKYLGCPPSNYRVGRSVGAKVYQVEAVVIHLSTSSMASLINTERNPGSHVSSHYGIGHDGTAVQFVGEANTAWHCGLSANAIPQPNTARQLIAKYGSWTAAQGHPRGWGMWKGLNLNLVTIGIENEGTIDDQWTEAQYRANAEIVRAAAARWKFEVNAETILPHHDINRLHSCPGPHCDIATIIALARG